jgi:hypothetical protein
LRPRRLCRLHCKVGLLASLLETDTSIHDASLKNIRGNHQRRRAGEGWVGDVDADIGPLAVRQRVHGGEQRGRAGESGTEAAGGPGEAENSGGNKAACGSHHH